MWHDAPVSATYKFLLKKAFLVETRATGGQSSVARKPKLLEDDGTFVESMCGTPLAVRIYGIGYV
jgi:hypothetical protein